MGEAKKHEAAQALEVRVGRGTPELLALEKHWRALAASLSKPALIHDFDWQWSYLDHLSSDPESIVYISFFANDQAVAIFPLSRVRRSVGRLRLWLWELPKHPHLVLGDMLVAQEWSRSDLIRRLLQTLDERLDLPWDGLHFHNMLEDSMARHLLLSESPALVHLEKTGQSMYFQCGNLETALANCSKRFKQNLRRQSRKLAQQGTVSLTLARQGTELDAAFTEFLRLESSGWKGRNGKASAIACHPRLLGFYRELKDRFAANNACLIALQKLNGIAIAAQLCFLSGSTLYIQKIAYDEAWKAEAPGNQLLLKVLEHACDNPAISHVSLITGPAWAVGRWNPESCEVWEAYVFKNNLRGLGALTMRRIKTRLWEPGKMLWKRVRGRLKSGEASTA